MRKVLSLLLIGILAISFVGMQSSSIVADEAPSTVEAADYDTTLPEMAAVRFDSAFGLNAYSQQYTATAIQATSDGGYIVGGMVVTDGWSLGRGQLVKFTADFEVDWSLSIEDHKFNYISALFVDSDGDIWIFSNDVVVDDNGTPEDDTDDITTKPRVLIQLSGTDRSEMGRYVSTADESIDWETEWNSNSIVELSNGNILVASTLSDELLYEIVDPSDMSLVASGTYGSTGDDKIENIKVDADPAGGFYLTGGFRAMDGSLASLGLTLVGNMDILVSKFDNAGAEQWTTQLSNTDGWNNAFAVEYYDGHVYLAGEQYGTADGSFTGLTNQGDSDAMIAKLDATDGSIVWTKIWGGTGTERFYDLQVTADGIFAGGFSNSSDGDLAQMTGPQDGNFVVKVGLDGSLKAAALHHARFNDSGGSAQVNVLDVLTTGEMVYAAKMGYWVNLYGNVTATDATHGFSNNSYNFDNPLEIGTWGKWAAGTAVVKFGVDTTAPVIEATPYLVVPTGYAGPILDSVSDDFAHPNRMIPGYTGALDFATAGVYDIVLTADDYAGNQGTFNRQVVVYDDLDGLTVNGETFTATIPKLVLMKDAEYTCGMAGVDIALSNNTLDVTCMEPDTSSLGEQNVVYHLTNGDFMIEVHRPIEVVLDFIGVTDGEEVYTEQEVRVPFGYQVMVDGVAAQDKDIISAVGTHTVAYYNPSDLDAYGVYEADGGTVALAFEDGMLKASVVSGANPFTPRIDLMGIPFEQDKTYQVSFDAKSSVDGKKLQIQAGELLSVSPWFTDFMGMAQVFTLGTDMQTFTFEFTMTLDNQNGGLTFELGNITDSLNINADVYMDNIQVQEVVTADPLDLGENLIDVGTFGEYIEFEILEVATGVKDGGFYADETTIAFDDTTYTATLNGDPFTTGTLVDTWGHYTFELTEIADPLNVITMEFVIGDANFMDLFEHGILEDVTYYVDGGLTRLNGVAATSDGGYIAVGDQDGAMYVVKVDSAGALEFEATMDSTGDDQLISVVEIAAGRFAAIGYIAAIDGDFTGTSLNPYPGGEDAWYNYRVLVDIHWDGTDVTFDAFNGNSVTEGLVNGNANYMGTSEIAFDSVDQVLYIAHVVDQWSFPAAGGYGSHDMVLAQYTVDADSFDFAWQNLYGSDGWDRVGRMGGIGMPLAVVPGEGVVTGYASKFDNGTPVDNAAELLASSTPWYDDGAGGEYEAIVVLRINDDGTTSWVKTMAGNDALFYIDAKVDAAGNIYIGGVHHTNVEPEVWPPFGDFGPDVDNASSDYDGNRDWFVAKLDSAGETIWLEVAGTEGGDELRAMELDADGNIIMVGYADGNNAIGGDLYVAPRLDNTRTLIAKVSAEGKLVGLESYNSEEFSIFNSVAILDDGSIVTVGYLRVDETFVQSQTDFPITAEIADITKFVGFTTMIEFAVDTVAPTVTSVPTIVVEEGQGSLALLNDYADTIFEMLMFDFEDDVDWDYLVNYMIDGTVDFDTPGTYTLDFIAMDMRMNESLVTPLTVHVVAENANEDGTLSLGGVDVVVADMGDADLDLDDDNSAFDEEAGTVTIAGETLMKYVYDVNETAFDIALPGVYDIVEVFANENYFVLLDRNITLLGGLIGIEDGVTYTEPVTGNFAGTATLNGVEYLSGTEITLAGTHTIELIEFEGATPIVVTFTITSGVNVEDAATYDKTTTPVFRGTATLNGEAFTSGTDISVPGEYELIITGNGDYSETYTFTITSGVNVEKAGRYDDSVIVIFRGTATLNGEAFDSGTEITLPGIYQLTITGVGDYVEMYAFNISSGFNGVEDDDQVDSGTTVTVRFNIGDATISKDGETATTLASGTRISEDGLYVITITGEGTYEEVITFRIGEEPITECPVGQELVDGECVAITCPTGQELEGNDCVAITCPTGQELEGNDCVAIVCDDGFELDGNDCVEIPEEEEEDTGCFGSLNLTNILFPTFMAFGAMVVLLKRRH
jgi:hypothetical protein